MGAWTRMHDWPRPTQGACWGRPWSVVAYAMRPNHGGGWEAGWHGKYWGCRVVG